MFFGKEVKVLLKGQAKERYIELESKSDKESKIILNSIKRVKELLLQNPQHGDPIRKELIPNELKQMNIQNLYRIELSNFWRLLYTLEGNENTLFVFVLKIMSHKEYDELFGY
ncbi:MAG: type II toxin-antitoxin system RelE/ParE family toxin [Nanoarchaeota archaeon]